MADSNDTASKQPAMATSNQIKQPVRDIKHKSPWARPPSNHLAKIDCTHARSMTEAKSFWQRSPLEAPAKHPQLTVCIKSRVYKFD